MQQQQIPPLTPFTVSLTAQDWSTILTILDEQPGKVGRPLWTSIMNQLQARAAMPPGNGQDYAATASEPS